MKKSIITQIMYVVLFIALVSSCGFEKKTWQKDKEYHITVLHTNDHHGRFWKNRNGEYGMAARKTLIDRIRNEVEANNGIVLLLSGGDINTGVPESDLQDAEPDFRGMSAIGYDAMALGNHEFDNPLEVLQKQEMWANFPFLSANIYDKTTGKRLFSPYKIFQKQDLRIAVVGLTTQDTAVIGNPQFLHNIEFRDPIAESTPLLNTLKTKADIIIAVTHMGHYPDANHKTNAPGDVSLARKTKGYNAIIGGHSQAVVCITEENKIVERYLPNQECTPDYQNGSYIMQAGEWGKYVGRADFTFKNGDFTLLRYMLIPVNLKKTIKENGKKVRVLIGDEITEDASMLQLLRPFQEKGSENLNVKIAQTNGKLEGDRAIVRSKPTNLGTIIAYAQMQSVGADIAVINSGGIRASIEKGDITYKDVLTVQPFGNTVTYVDLGGSDLQEYLTTIANIPEGTGGYAQFAGLAFTMVEEKLTISINNKPLDENATYRLAINSYIASGGDKYPILTDKPSFVDSGYVDAEVLKSYMEEKGIIDAHGYTPAR